LPKGDYIREEYLHSLCETRSPLRTWQEIGAEKDGGLDQITIDGDVKNISVAAGYNFHEGTGPFSPENDGTLRRGDVVYSIDSDGVDGFHLSDGKSTIHFRFVGDWQLWANRAVVAGIYQDEKGSKYRFGTDGVAHFPDNRSFDYKVGLDMILSNYDYIYSNQLKSTWAVKMTSGGLSLYDVDVDQNEPYGLVAKNPRWRLKQLTPVSCR
jgi:hypothetical protein